LGESESSAIVALREEERTSLRGRKLGDAASAEATTKVNTRAKAEVKVKVKVEVMKLCRFVIR